MAKIVQFTHPGPEHAPDNKDRNHKDWNQGNHARKYLLSAGSYVVDDSLRQGKLFFWGEWEPPSHVRALASTNVPCAPRWLHIPYLPAALPSSTVSGQPYQNTDPFVFGGAFKYFVCKQFQNKRQRITPLARLEKGDIILFGSTKGKLRASSFFQLDTVFVISHYYEYDISDAHALRDVGLGDYWDIVFKMGFPQPANYSLKLRLYVGATHAAPVNGMYSYSPCKVWAGEDVLFPRIKLKDLSFITNNLNAAPKITEVSLEESVRCWNTIRDISRAQGCFEGVRFNMPKVLKG